MFDIEVVFALPARQALYRVTVEEGTTVRSAIEASGVLRDFPDIDLTRFRVGIYARLVRLDTALKSGDRVEIYRPLRADPKEARRTRAATRRKEMRP